MKTGSKVTLGIVALVAGALALLKRNGVAGIGATFDWYEVFDKPIEAEYGDEETQEFAEKNGVKLYALAKAYDVYFPGDRDERWIYKMKIKRGKESYTFTFGQSIAAGDSIPTYYDVLAAFTKYDPYSFEDFCADYGYDPDSRRAYQTYKAVKKEYEAVERLFGDIMDEVQEINGISGTKGCGAVLWEYAIMELKNAGVRLNENYFALSSRETDELSRVMKKFGYRMPESSRAMGRTPRQSFYYAIQRHLK